MVPFISLEDLYKDVFRRSTLIALPSLSKLLQVKGSEFSKWEVFYQIVFDALAKFEYHYPLGRVQRVHIEVNRTLGTAKYFPNFEAWLNGVLDELDIVLPMMSCQGLSYTPLVNSQTPYRDFKFENGQFIEFWYSSGNYYCNCLCKRPLFEEYIREGKQNPEPSKRCGLYFMEKYQDNQFTIFRDQLYLEVCRYIIDIRKNFNLPNMPIELFQGLEEDFNRVDGQLSQIYQSALRSSPWLI